MDITQIIISIHALAKRATNPEMTKGEDNGYFNPRPRKEGDSRYSPPNRQLPDFNPRPRKEGDDYDGRLGCFYAYFNPRPRKEGD